MKKIVRNILVSGMMVAFSMVFSSPVQAAGSCSGGLTGNCNPICSSQTADDEQKAAAGCTVDANDNVGNHVVNIVNGAISVVGIVGVLVIVMAGQRFMTANGDPGRIKQAKDMVLWAVIGIVVAALAWAIITFVLNALPTQTTP